MNKRPTILKRTLLAMLFAVLFIHMVYDKFEFMRIPPLKGIINYPQKPGLSSSGWFSGNYQAKQDVYMNAMFGFRSLYIRLHNQVDFSLFKKINASGVLLGKENYLYEEKYINAYNGKDFIGLDSINLLLNQMKFISGKLQKMNKQLVIVFAAGKASFYPEYFPDNYKKVNDSTNYKFLSEGAKKAGLHVIDFNKWFVQNKNTAKYPLYPKYANHWSTYGAVLAADSIINYIQYLKNQDLPNLVYDTIDLKKPFGIDYDIADGMNLLRKFKSVDMAYPRISTENPKGKTKPSVLMISDSFYWQMVYFGISNSFHNDHFWYYNKEVYPPVENKGLVTELNLEKEIEKHDVIMVMATEANLYDMGWGVFSDLQHYFNGAWAKKEYFKKVQELKIVLKNNPDWMDQIKQKAIERKVSVDSMIKLDALWVIEHPDNK